MITLISWAVLVLYIAKIRVGKDATITQIMTYLAIAGPVGWAIIIIIFIYDIVDRLPKLFRKISQKHVDK